PPRSRVPRLRVVPPPATPPPVPSPPVPSPPVPPPPVVLPPLAPVPLGAASAPALPSGRAPPGPPARASVPISEQPSSPRRASANRKVRMYSDMALSWLDTLRIVVKLVDAAQLCWFRSI